MKENISTQIKNFSDLGIAPRLVEILTKLELVTPTDIQQKAIPPAIEGKDIVGIAQTGTGKTLAFAVPMIQYLLGLLPNPLFDDFAKFSYMSRTEKSKELSEHTSELFSERQIENFAKGQNMGFGSRPSIHQESVGLVMVPTRELATQVEEAFQKIGRPLGLKTALLIGGVSPHYQVNALRRAPHIIIGTPGRINDHLNQKKLGLANATIVVLDEADRMLDIGFLPQIKRILQVVPHERQTMLFSATLPDEVFAIATRYMKLPVRIEIARSGTVAERVDQEFFVVSIDQKIRLLEKILNDYNGSVLIFSRTKYGAKRLTNLIRQWGHAVAEIHSNRSPGQRRDAMENFKSGKYRILVATDIASRGIDVTGISLVINYDLPQQAEDYVHRIGRTGRAGLTGKAISFALPDQRHKVRSIERLIRTAIVISQLPELPPGRPTTFMPATRPVRKLFSNGTRPIRNRYSPRRSSNSWRR